MLVDLARNDPASRASGTITVEPYRAVERYTVMHREQRLRRAQEGATPRLSERVLPGRNRHGAPAARWS
jgi:hypothetical protein